MMIAVYLAKKTLCKSQASNPKMFYFILLILHDRFLCQHFLVVVVVVIIHHNGHRPQSRCKVEPSHIYTDNSE